MNQSSSVVGLTADWFRSPLWPKSSGTDSECTASVARLFNRSRSSSVVSSMLCIGGLSCDEDCDTGLAFEGAVDELKTSAWRFLNHPPRSQLPGR